MIIRAYQLQKGDRFRILGTIHKVTSKTPGKIWYDWNSGRNKSTRFMGAKSQERVELIINLSNTNK